MNWAWTVPDLNPTERLTLLAISDNADDEGYAFPGQESLARRVGVSRRTILSTLQNLEARGLFARERRTLATGQRTSDGFRLGLGANLAREDHDRGNVQTVAPTKEPSVEPSDLREKRGRASRIPEPFIVTAEMWEWCREKGYEREWVREHTERFVDYWRGAPGAKGTKMDWPGTWRNWLRRAWDDRRPSSRGGRESPDEQFRRLAAWAEQMDGNGTPELTQ